MPRLVQEPKTSLNEEDIGRIWGGVKAWFNQHRTFYLRCERGREWFKRLDRGVRKHRGNYPKIVVNLAYAHAQSLIATLFVNNPKIRALPVHPKHEDSVKVWDDLLALVYERTRYDHETFRTIFSSIVYPESWKKWTVLGAGEEGEEKDLGSEEPTDTFSGLDEANKRGHTPWDEMAAPIGVRVAPTQIATDTIDRDLDNANWVIVRYEKKWSELVADPKYPNITEKTVRESKPVGDILGPGGIHGGIGRFVHTTVEVESRSIEDRLERRMFVDADRTVLYECWCYQDVQLNLYKQVVVLVEGMENMLAREITPWEDYIGPNVTGWPFNKLELNWVPDDRPLAELGVFKGLQEGIEWMVERIVAKSENIKQLYNFYPQNAKNPARAKAQFMSSSVREAVEARDVGQPVFEAVQQHSVDREDYSVVQVLQGLLQEISGQSKNRRGGAGIRTAREAVIIEQSASGRDSVRQKLVDDFLKRDSEICSGILRTVTPAGFLIRSIGTTGSIKWKKFNDFDRSWAPDFRVEPSAHRTQDRAEQAQNLSVALDRMMQLVPVAPSMLAPIQETLTELLRVLQVPGATTMMQDVESPAIKQMQEIVFMTTNGKPAPVSPEDNHVIELRTMDQFENSQMAQGLPPQVLDALAQHRAEHERMQQQLGEAMQGASGPTRPENGFDRFNQGGTDAQINGQQQGAGAGAEGLFGGA